MSADLHHSITEEVSTELSESLRGLFLVAEKKGDDERLLFDASRKCLDALLFVLFSLRKTPPVKAQRLRNSLVFGSSYENKTLFLAESYKFVHKVRRGDLKVKSEAGDQQVAYYKQYDLGTAQIYWFWFEYVLKDFTFYYRSEEQTRSAHEVNQLIKDYVFPKDLLSERK